MPGWFFNLLVYLGVSGPILAAIWGCFNALDRRLKPNSRRLLARYLAGLPGRLRQSLPDSFIDLFDSVFRTRTVAWPRLGMAFSRPSLWRSFQVSLLLSTALAIVFAVRIVAVPHPILEGWTADIDANFVLTKITAFLISALLFNTIVDYLSLLESRFIIKWMFSAENTKSRATFIRLLLFTILDLFATSIILIVSWILIGPIAIEIISFSYFDFGYSSISEMIEGYSIVKNMMFGGDSGTLLYAVNGIVNTMHSFFAVDDPTGIYGSFVISTFFTSIWVWLFVFGAIAARVVGMVGSAVGIWSRHFFFVS